MARGLAKDVIGHYLDRHANPGSVAVARAVDGVYERVLTIPVSGESEAFVSGIAPACRGEAGRTLVIVCVNGRSNAQRWVHDKNQALLSYLRATLRDYRALSRSPTSWLGVHECFDLLVIDHASGDARFGPQRGVGWARRVTADVALALIARGAVRTPWIHATDADAVLPQDYFFAGRDPQAAVRIYPFWHALGGSDTEKRALALYEISLRYFVLGLAWARSPWAFHTVGSTIAVSALGYAQVRGVPDRQAGEDFYLLHKLAKVGRVEQLTSGEITLVQRPGVRVPFGTARGTADNVRRLDAGDEIAIYAPMTFVILREVHRLVRGCLHGKVAAAAAGERGLDAIPEGGVAEMQAEGGAAEMQAEGAAAEMEAEGAVAEVDAEGTVAETAAQEVMRWLEIEARIRSLLRTQPTASHAERAFFEWFDGFRTLKVIHRLRDTVCARVPIAEALAAAPFCSALEDRAVPWRSLETVERVRRSLRDLDRERCRTSE